RHFHRAPPVFLHQGLLEQCPRILKVGHRHHAQDASGQLHPAVAYKRGGVGQEEVVGGGVCHPVLAGLWDRMSSRAYPVQAPPLTSSPSPPLCSQPIFRPSCPCGKLLDSLDRARFADVRRTAAWTHEAIRAWCWFTTG